MAAPTDLTPSQLFDLQFQRLADFEPVPFPVISIYLNTQPDNHGRDNFESFLRHELAARARTYATGSAEAESFARDTERIQAYIENELKPAANGLALFVCAGADDFFEAVQLQAPIEAHHLYISDQPHLYHLARLDGRYPRYAALVTDANSARLFVFGLGEKLSDVKVQGKKVQRVRVGGWSQARYQRRVENAHRDHAKEAIDALDRIVREEKIPHVIIAGDTAMVPELTEQLPKHLTEKMIDVMRLDTKAPEQEIFEATLEAIHEKDAATDEEQVKRLFDLYRAGGLAVAGVKETLKMLENGQVEELLIGASLETAGAPEELGDRLVTKAKQTSAQVRFIEDPALLASVGGAGAFLRWG
jgi:peptide subunit release factor 1 (eRF1)